MIISDLGYILNGAMFSRNGRSGYVLKPNPLRYKVKEGSIRRIKHVLTIKVCITRSLLYLDQQCSPPAVCIRVAEDMHGMHVVFRFPVPSFLDIHYVLQVISAQQLPPLASTSSSIHSSDSIPSLDPYVTLTLHHPPLPPIATTTTSSLSNNSSSSTSSPLLPPQITPITRAKTSTIEDNGFNPVWNETKTLTWLGIEGMDDLAFVRFEVRHEGRSGAFGAGGSGEDRAVAGYCVSVGCLNQGEHLVMSTYLGLWKHPLSGH